MSGCQSYAPRPLDAAAHGRAWQERTAPGAGDEGVAAFVRRLAEEGAGEAGPYDPSDGISLREAEVVALLFNPDLRAARLRADAALASARHAGLWEDPQFGVDAERILASVDEPWVVGATLGITLPISGRLAVEEARAGAAHRAELRRVAAQEWGVRAALRAAWLAWSAQELRAEQTRRLLDRLDTIVGIVRSLEDAGELSRIEARLFRIERAVTASSLLAVETRATELVLELRALMGLSPAAPLTLVPAPLGAADARSATLEDLSARNPEIAALRAEYEVAEEALRLEIRKQYPDLVIGPGLGVEDGDGRVLLGLSLPIPLWNRNQRGIAEAAAQREIARAAFETQLERLGAALAAAGAQLDAARAQRELLERTLVPMVEEQDAESLRVARLGEVDTPLLLDSLSRLYQARAALIDAHLAESLAAQRIQELIGPPPPAPEPSLPDTDTQSHGAAR